MRLLLSFVVALVTSLVATAAFGQATISVVNEQSLPRLDKNGAVIAKRDLTLTPEGVNLQDCVDDQQIRFTLQLGGFEANGRVEMWASTTGDCKASTARGTGGVATCWSLGANVPLTISQDVPIRVRKMMAGIGNVAQAASRDTPDLCGSVDLTTVSVHFVYFPPGQTEGSVDKAITINVDTVGPEPPGGLSVLPGNGRLQIRWNSISGGDSDAGTSSNTGSGVVALTGVKVYCDPNVAATTTREVANDPVCTDVPNDASADVDETGDAGDAGTTQVCTDGGTRTETTAGACVSNAFTGDGGTVYPTATFNSQYECGSIVGNSGTSIQATSVGGAPLANGRRYAVAVAATDAYGNVGALSDPLCEVPAETTDFWEQYKTAGGSAGGCATTGAEAPLGTMGIVAVIAVTAIRRRRQRR